jgi:hypothetical protein
MRRTLIIACAAGFVASAIACAALVLAPAAVERQVNAAAIALMKEELAKRFGPELRDDEVVSRVEQRVGRHIAALREKLDSPLIVLAGVVLAQLCHYDCSPSKVIAESLRTGIRSEIHRFEGAALRVRSWAMSRYSALITEFVHELRIFTGSNALLFLLALLGLTRAPTHRGVQTVSVLIVVATLTAAWFYVMHQNWLLTFVLADYVGWSYLIWVGVVFVFLVDVVFLRGTIAQAVVSALI